MLRLIAIFKLVKALALFASLVTVLNLVRHHDPSVLTWALRLHVDPENRYLCGALAVIFNLDATHLSVLAVGTGLYGVLYSVEGFGLWFERAWAEYVTIVATAGFIPIECYENLGTVTISKVMLLALNVTIIAYLIVDVRHRRAPVERCALTIDCANVRRGCSRAFLMRWRIAASMLKRRHTAVRR